MVSGLPDKVSRAARSLCAFGYGSTRGAARKGFSPTPSHHAESRAVACNASNKLIFMGTPEVATIPLRELMLAAACDGSDFEVAAVVTRPPQRARRSLIKALVPSPVHMEARRLGIPEDRILTPSSSRDEDFLATVEALSPGLCVTAAYGAMLPQRLLDTPRHGTLNIHPSLLPRYRGAAPVPRALEAGEVATGVSLTFTVLRCDAGPVLAQERVELSGDEQAPELLADLFHRGSKLLLSALPTVWTGEAAAAAEAQDEAAATHAPRMTRAEADLDFSRPARDLHNQVRAFAGWPGTRTYFHIVGRGREDTVQVKVLRTRLPGRAAVAGSAAAPASGGGEHEAERQWQNWCEGRKEAVVREDAIAVCCGDGEWLEVTELQAAGRKACSAAAYRNRLAKCRLFVGEDAIE